MSVAVVVVTMMLPVRVREHQGLVTMQTNRLMLMQPNCWMMTLPQCPQPHVAVYYYLMAAVAVAWQLHPVVEEAAVVRPL
jgi:hypothetical protein